jgi:diguanylate cyclase (GGDEF)-like protein/putative nucleotidyltransferase with HDIG domain
MTSGMALWLVGALVLVGYVATRGLGNTPSPSYADIFSIAYIPLTLGILLSLGKIKPPFDAEKKQFLVNIMMMALAMFLLCYRFVLIPSWNSSSDEGFIQKMLTIVYLLYDWTIFVSLLIVSYRFRSSRIEGWLVLLVAAFSSAIIGDFATYLTADQLGLITTLSMIIMATFMAISAIEEVTGAFIGTINRRRTRISEKPEIQALAQNPWRTLLTPFMANIVIPIVWLASIHDGRSEGVPVLVAVSTAIIMLSIYRNHLLASDYAILSTKTLRDSLTGLNNFRYFQEALSRVIARSDKIKKPVSLIAIDLDDFGELNKVYGHSFGDKVLAAVADVITSKIREDDEACRRGGDDFAIIMPDTSSAMAYAFAMQLKDSIDEALRVVLPDNPLTVTMGVSAYPTLAVSKEDFACTADGALYWGKINGKNAIIVYDREVVEVLSAEERARKAEESLLLDMVRTLAKAVDARDPYTRRHSQGVSKLAGKLASACGLDEQTVSQIKAAGILHDVGKIGMPDEILSKPERLTREEISVIRNHPVLSAHIIQSTSLKDMVPAIRAHHERWDGTGYPDGLKGEEIPVEARILAIADTFDAMTTDRPYRGALTVADALSEIKRCAGTQFDPKLVDVFVSMFSGPSDWSKSKDAPTSQAKADYDVASGL